MFASGKALPALQYARRTLANQQYGPCFGLCFVGTYQPAETDTVSIVRKRGMDVLHDPINNSKAPRLAQERC